jgi:hypothetical protein
MITIEGENPITALLRDHAHRIVPVIHALAATLFLGRLHQDEHEHRIIQSKSGANSYGLYLADGRSFHFRGVSEHGHYDAIHVYDRWTYTRDGVEPVAVLRTPGDAVEWARKLRHDSVLAYKNGLGPNPWTVRAEAA